MHPCMASALAGQCIAVAMHNVSAQAVFKGVLCEARKRFSYQHEGGPVRSTRTDPGTPCCKHTRGLSTTVGCTAQVWSG
jgi:hypothetical protein